MGSVAHLIVAAIMVAMLVYAIRRYREQRAIWVLAFGGVVAGLIYDNAILGLGWMIGEGSTLYALTLPRFWIHALFTPLLGMFGWYIARRSGARWALGMPAYAIFGTLTIVGVAIGVITDASKMDYVFKVEEGVARYAHARAGAPIASILALLLALVGAIAMGVRTKRWEFAVGCVVFFVIAASRVGGVIGNLGELALVISALVTERHFTGQYVPFTARGAQMAGRATP
jgi:hypothetical protein